MILVDKFYAKKLKLELAYHYFLWLPSILKSRLYLHMYVVEGKKANTRVPLFNVEDEHKNFRDILPLVIEEVLAT